VWGGNTTPLFALALPGGYGRLRRMIRSLQPVGLWTLFAEICAIPHPSGHEAALRRRLAGLARAAGLAADEDNAGNLRIVRPARPGREHAPRVILQSHLDMVPQHSTALPFDCMRDPIVPVVDGDRVHTGGRTTLGADNGIGVAAALDVLLGDCVRHGPLAALFTVEEETGLRGAEQVDPAFLDGDILLNLDSEDAGAVTVGCAGGCRIQARFPFTTKHVPAGLRGAEIAVSGLAGGHSGCDIDKRRGNAVAILCELLDTRPDTLAGIDGGGLENAIPRDARAVLALPEAELGALRAAAAACLRAHRTRLGAGDPGLRIDVTECPPPARAWSAACRTRILDALRACPNGVLAMSAADPARVATSANLAAVRTDAAAVTVKVMPRSESASALERLVAAIRAGFEAAGGQVSIDHAYPGWEPNPESGIVRIIEQVYGRRFGSAPRRLTIHAGLECGVLGAVNPALDMASFGPDIHDPHSPAEWVSIASVRRFASLLHGVLEAL
jgi:dipeptidase D